MDDKTVKIILIVVAVLVLVTCLGGGALIAVLVVFRGSHSVDVAPAPTMTPGVKEGAGYLKKRLVTEAQGFAPLNGLYMVDLGRDGTQEFVVMGEISAGIFDQQWRGLKAVKLEGVDPASAVVPFDAQGDGVIEFLCQSGDTGDHLFLNSEGKPVEFTVKHGEYTGVEVADADGDGRAEILYGAFDPGCIRLYDLSGRQLWSHDIEELMGFDFIDLPGGGKVIATIDGEESSSIRDPRTGQVIQPCEGKEYWSDLRSVRWIGDSAESHFLLTGDDFQVYDSGGKRTVTIPTFDADDIPMCAYGSSVKLGPAEPELFAVALVYDGIDVLCLIDATGKRRYAEVLDGVPMDVVGLGEHVYVALDSGVWDYTLATGSDVTAEDGGEESAPVAGNN